MPNQSTLTIGGIGADPSGTHPTGALSNWLEEQDDASIKYTFTFTDPGAQDASCNVDFFSDELCLHLLPGMIFEIGDTQQAECKAVWQWYNPGDGADFSTDGFNGTFGNGTWTDIGTLASNYTAVTLSANDTAHALAMNKGTKVRIKLNVTDAGSDEVSAAVIDDAIAGVNAGYMIYPVDHEAKHNISMVEQYSGQTTTGGSGGIGKDPS